MPRKAQYTREQIIDAAYELVRMGGEAAVTARSVANKLGCTTMPIFSFFTGMGELRSEVCLKAKKICTEYLMASVGCTPTFKEFGLRWVRLASTEPRLFSFLFSAAPSSIMEEFSKLFSVIRQSVQDSFCLNAFEAKELMEQMIIYANGIASFLIRDPELLTEQEVGRRLSDVCIGLVISIQMKNGTYNEEFARRMLEARDELPVKNT